MSTQNEASKSRRKNTDRVTKSVPKGLKVFAIGMSVVAGIALISAILVALSSGTVSGNVESDVNSIGTFIVVVMGVLIFFVPWKRIRKRKDSKNKGVVTRSGPPMFLVLIAMFQKPILVTGAIALGTWIFLFTDMFDAGASYERHQEKLLQTIGFEREWKDGDMCTSTDLFCEHAIDVKDEVIDIALHDRTTCWHTPAQERPLMIQLLIDVEQEIATSRNGKKRYFTDKEKQALYTLRPGERYGVNINGRTVEFHKSPVDDTIWSVQRRFGSTPNIHALTARFTGPVGMVFYTIRVNPREFPNGCASSEVRAVKDTLTEPHRS